ncbi:hypothetical protein V757_00260 [Pelistega indica]|uniref:Lipoprotein n=1 Tax=Pelistega indica TaxID=1414851 RepID=V8GBK6_9BURK|nr:MULTISPECIES: hypothetical protein [Pelistega]ETD73142.1 hypothetical protein V757_00260 [Pelistega indica]
MTSKLRFTLKKTVLCTIFLISFLSGCYSTPYPTDIQNELLSYCKDGIESGLTVVRNGKTSPMTPKEIDKLCQFRLSEFMKEVSLEDYLALNKHIYDNFKNAFANKYVLKDIYDTLSPDDKRVNTAIAVIILGLEPKNEQ